MQAASDDEKTIIGHVNSTPSSALEKKYDDKYYSITKIITKCEAALYFKTTTADIIINLPDSTLYERVYLTRRAKSTPRNDDKSDHDESDNETYEFQTPPKKTKNNSETEYRTPTEKENTKIYQKVLVKVFLMRNVLESLMVYKTVYSTYYRKGNKFIKIGNIEENQNVMNMLVQHGPRLNYLNRIFIYKTSTNDGMQEIFAGNKSNTLFLTVCEEIGDWKNTLARIVNEGHSQTLFPNWKQICAIKFAFDLLSGVKELHSSE